MARVTHICMEMSLQWQSELARHVDRQYFEKVNLWRDIFPCDLSDQLVESKIDQIANCDVAAGELTGVYEQNQVKTIPRDKFNTRPHPGLLIEPRLGRFYPRSFLQGVPGINGGDHRPLRIIALNSDNITVDLNAPFARFPARIKARVVDVLEPKAEHGGRCNDFAYDMTKEGAGMQAAMPGMETDFFTCDAFCRVDERDDQQFYQQPRLVQHIDAMAQRHVRDLYARFIQPGSRVLDLMGSWVSHLPDGVSGLQVTGLGMNAEELAANKCLTEQVTHDLNQLPELPFAEQTFDCVICSMSVEYLIKPLEVFTELARVIRPGGQCVVTFSDRWFPPKAIQLWSELHPFERIALVTEYFRRGGQFVDLQTESIRYWPRPADDKYADQRVFSDPVFAVWGRRK